RRSRAAKRRRAKAPHREACPHHRGGIRHPAAGGISIAEVRMSDAGSIKVLAVCGSLRKASYNMAALRVAIAQKPPGMSVEVADISQIPPYNEGGRQEGFAPTV